MVNRTIRRKIAVLQSLFQKVAGLQPWTLYSNKGGFLWNMNTFFTEHFQWLLMHLLICRDSATAIFLWILENFEKHYWPPPVAASFCYKMLNIKQKKKKLWQQHAISSMFDGKCSQWGNRFIPITKRNLEPNRKCTMKFLCKNS